MAVNLKRVKKYLLYNKYNRYYTRQVLEKYQKL